MQLKPLKLKNTKKHFKYLLTTVQKDASKTIGSDTGATFMPKRVFL
jgi:hypothetical protein